MANYIVLRLLPPAATDPGQFLADYLTGLTVTVYDLAYQNATSGVLLGSASFAATQIVQHSSPPLPGPVGTFSVATALIEYTAPDPEYDGSPDLRVEFDRPGAAPLFAPRSYYNVALYDLAGPFPTPDAIQTIPDENVSAFVTLPPATSLLTAPTDSTPPNFDALDAAVRAVLTADPGGGPPSDDLIADLSIDQCRNIANELAYQHADPLPGPPPSLLPQPEPMDSLQDMYTYPTNNGQVSTNSHEQNRRQFEGALAAYYGPPDAAALRLTTYVFALSSAYWCRRAALNATSALVTFPVNPNGAPSQLTTEAEAQILFTGAVGQDVPASYFYALTYNQSIQSDKTSLQQKQSRQQLISGTAQQTNLDAITRAVDLGWIDLVAATNPAQAARIIEAFNIPPNPTMPSWDVVVNPSPGQVWSDWLKFPPTVPGLPVLPWRNYQEGDDETIFWPAEAAPAGSPVPFLEVVLYVLTQGYQVGPQFLYQEIEADLLGGPPLAVITDVSTATPAQWQTLFQTLGAAFLPPFTLPGNTTARIAAFIAYVQKFFQLGTTPPVITAAPVEGLPRFHVPSSAADLIARTIAAYAGFVLGTPLNRATLEAAALTATPGDAAARAWVVQAIWTLNDLYIVAQIPGATEAFDGSVMEALFARGFTSVESILDLPLDDFQQALIGTIAYDQAATLYNNAVVASGAPAPIFVPPGSTPFGPINPGSLTDCIPPQYLSPLGPVEYLHEMLRTSERSTCDHPFATPAPGHTTLQGPVESRRGPIGTLAVTRANLDTPLPLIDMVDECLEFMASTSPPTPHGTVYNTSENSLAGYKLCEDHCDEDEVRHDCACAPHECDCRPDPREHPDCHQPHRIFDALPEYSTPATPITADAAVEPAAWNKLKNDFSACCLPYDQALDVNRTYLEHFDTCRFETMRTFRRCITEFVLDPTHQPADFQTHLWRYPVRLDIAIEYLGLSPEEFTTWFAGVMPGPCSHETRKLPRPAPNAIAPGGPTGFASTCMVVDDRQQRDSNRMPLPQFLKCVCLTYCEFVELWKCGFVPFRNGHDRRGAFPECEPCCLEELWVEFPEPDPAVALEKLRAFVHLWLKLRHRCGAGYTFVELADICTVLGFGTPDFIRKLAAFQMLRDQFRLKLTGHEPPAAGATGADRTFLLSLWVGPAATHWHGAIQQLLEGIARHAECRHECERRAPEFIKLLAANLEPLSRLAGFDPAVATDTWWAAPTHTLRFAEILAKIYASPFSIGEVLFLFTAEPHLDGEDPFPLQEPNEADDEPLGLPEDAGEHSLRQLRRKLLEVEVREAGAEGWSWHRVEAALTHEFGFPAQEVTRLGAHFFAEILEESGQSVTPADRRFIGALAATNAHMWNSTPRGPFRYDTGAHELWAVLPIVDREVFEQLQRVQALNAAERQAVQDVYFQPRRVLSHFGCLFEDFAAAEHHLIEAGEAHERWRYFQHQFAKAHERCRIIAEHLSRHVEATTGQPCPSGSETARLILKHLLADENGATSPAIAPAWENDNGTLPSVMWSPPANGGAYAALLGLTGTGLDGKFTVGGGPVVWREIRDSMHPFGRALDHENCPVPTVIPTMGLTLTPAQMKYVTVRNGFAMDDAKGRWLGGAQAFEVTWRGVLFIDHHGEYRFQAGAPLTGNAEEEGEHPTQPRQRSWRVVLKRGQKTWVLLRHDWHHEENLEPAALHLQSGAYDLEIEFVQHAPEYLREDAIHPASTGFEIRYRGPDTHDCLEPIPNTHLFRTHDDGPMEVAGLSGSPAHFLHDHYRSSLRDIRRTYQRAFKALLFAHRFELSPVVHHLGESELGYLLSEARRFAGRSYYRNAGVFTTHRADFNFNFLPVRDNYFPPVKDDRAHPSLQRVQALFDWWERIFDYRRVRTEVRAHCDRHLWLLFAEARDEKPADPASLLRHLGADARHWYADLHYYQDQTAPIYAVKTADLMDERWTVRAWHADLWLRRLWCHFTVKDIEKARPDLWASEDPQSLVFGQTQTGNANLLQFLCDGCFDDGAPHRYDDVRRLNDGLRERGREALTCYLCAPGGIARSANELSELLLLDVQSGQREKASRIEEAISAVQTFVRRARLGLEPTWIVTSGFAHLWDCRFASYHIWQACKRRELYKENAIEWHELEKAGKVEAFGLLDEQLKRATLTVAEPAGADYWPSRRTPDHPELCLLQQRDPAEVKLLNEVREGLDFLATPERAARPSWITTVPEYTSGQLATVKPVRNFPLWMECAIRMGTRFVRVAAAHYPPAATHYAPWHDCHEHPQASNEPHKDKECCVTCCEECGCEHPAHIDEYYFWLLDARHFTPEAQAAYSGIFDGQQSEYYDQNQQVATPWHDPTATPSPFAWPSSPLVRLAWCRIHNGEFQQPRRSTWGIAYAEGSPSPDLAFEGRVGDSLYFSLTNPATAGFRYDMVPDAAHELATFAVPPVPSAPPSTLPLPPPAPLPGPMVAYPYFLYSHPGERLFPWSIYSPAVSVGRALRIRCRFEAALKWYELAYNPLDNDNRWALCEEAATLAAAPDPTHTCCCDTTDVTCREARHRSVLLDYLDTLREWVDALLRRKSPESFQQASTLCEIMRKIMGRHPRRVENHKHPHPPMTVATFKPLWAPINPRLITLYDQLDDRLTLIHECMTARRLVEGQRRADAEYWGDDPVRYGWHTLLQGCCATDGSCRPCRPYRFEFRIQKAKEWAGQARELGAALLTAFEKGDTEFATSMRARQESELAHLNLRASKDAWRESDWQVQALEKSKLSLQSSRRYYAGLIAAGLNQGENGYVAMLGQSMAERTAANVTEGIAEAMDMIPDIFVGEDNFVQIPVGTKLAGLFKTISRISNTLADIAGTTAQLDLTQAGWDRRQQDWVHQVAVLDIQIEQAELQILGTERGRDRTLRQLNIQQRTIEQATETLDLLRDKFTNHAVYLYLQKHSADLYRQFYELALREAHECQQVFNFERGHTDREFVRCGGWNNLHEGLLAGERLYLDLCRMEKEYYDHNCREYELTKHISLRQGFPLEFLRLKVTGQCEIELPEWMFDLDYPGQYMRRLKTVSLTIPAVAGPYNEVHCRLTLLRSGTRIDPLPSVPAARCCDCCQSHNGYPICPHDPRWVSENGALEAIATSSGVNDAGLFEVNFNDARYLPFEYRGAVSRWRVELPHENNFFEMEQLSDVILNIGYTSREGGEGLRRAARAATECDLPGAGWCLFDLRHDFADAWELFRRQEDGRRQEHDHDGDHPDHRRLTLHFERNMFPFVPGHRELFIETMVLLYDRCTHCGCECPAECPCCANLACAHQELILERPHAEERRFRCVADAHWPDFYHGVIPEVCIGPMRERRQREHVTLFFPHSLFPQADCEIENAYLLCRYTLKDPCCPKPKPVRARVEA